MTLKLPVPHPKMQIYPEIDTDSQRNKHACPLRHTQNTRFCVYNVYTHVCLCVYTVHVHVCVCVKELTIMTTCSYSYI